MAAFELNIYGNDDEILKTFSTNKVRWGVFIQAFEVQETLDKKSVSAQVELINAFMRKLFPNLTEKDLENADIDDVMNVFKQLLNKANQIGGGKLKNGVGVE